MHDLKLVVPVELCLMAQRLACQDKDLIGDVHDEHFCHMCVVPVGLVEGL